MEDEVAYYKNYCMELEQTLTEYKVAYRDIDRELEREIEQMEMAYTDMKTKMLQLQTEADGWKYKYREDLDGRSSTVEVLVFLSFFAAPFLLLADVCVFFEKLASFPKEQVVSYLHCGNPALAGLVANPFADIIGSGSATANHEPFPSSVKIWK